MPGGPAKSIHAWLPGSCDAGTGLFSTISAAWIANVCSRTWVYISLRRTPSLSVPTAPLAATTPRGSLTPATVGTPVPESVTETSTGPSRAKALSSAWSCFGSGLVPMSSTSMPISFGWARCSTSSRRA